jgi:hypothetical protein
VGFSVRDGRLIVGSRIAEVDEGFAEGQSTRVLGDVGYLPVGWVGTELLEGGLYYDLYY